MTLEDIYYKVDDEELGYFLLSYASPDIVDTRTDDGIEFKDLWERVLPSLRRMVEILEKYGPGE